MEGGGSQAIPSTDMLAGQSQAGEGCVATSRSSSEMGESWASFLGTTLGWGLKPLGSYRNQQPRAMFNCFPGHQVRCLLISGGSGPKRHGIWRFWEVL